MKKMKTPKKRGNEKRANNSKITKEREETLEYTIQIEWRVIFGCWSGEFPFSMCLNTDNDENVPVATC